MREFNSHRGLIRKTPECLIDIRGLRIYFFGFSNRFLRGANGRRRRLTSRIDGSSLAGRLGRFTAVCICMKMGDATVLATLRTLLPALLLRSDFFMTASVLRVSRCVYTYHLFRQFCQKKNPLESVDSKGCDVCYQPPEAPPSPMLPPLKLGNELELVESLS